VSNLGMIIGSPRHEKCGKRKVVCGAVTVGRYRFQGTSGGSTG